MISFLTVLALSFLLDSNIGGAPSLAQQRFPAGYPSPGDAATDNQSTDDRLSKALAAGQKRRSCALPGNRSTPCVLDGSDKLFLSPFPLALPENDVEDSLTSWVPVSSTINGVASLREWQRTADEGEGQTSKCTSREPCKVIVHTVDSGLASCYVEILQHGALSAPNGCSMIAVSHRGTDYLEAVVGIRGGFVPPPTSEGRVDFGAGSAIVFASSKPEMAARVKEALVGALMAPPLKLSSEIEPSGDVLGTASRRRSDILSGWREFVTIRLQVREAPSKINIDVISTLYVNRQNTTSSADWSMPSKEQTDAWVDAVKSNVKGALGRLCARPHWMDSQNLVCTSDLSEATVEAGAIDESPISLPPVIHFCGGNCFTLVLSGGRYVRANKVVVNNVEISSVWTVERFTRGSVILHRHDSPNPASRNIVNGFDATYTGHVVNDRLMNIRVNGSAENHAQIAWGSALSSVPGSNEERDLARQAPKR
jgi:hypothetical protein